MYDYNHAKESFLRMTYDNTADLVTFQSRTPQRVHYQLVTRVFKATETTFDNDKYVFVPSDNQDQQQHNQHNQRRYAGAPVSTFGVEGDADAGAVEGGGGDGGRRCCCCRRSSTWKRWL
jgi:hypothetical protein